MLVLSLLAVACAALVGDPWPALALCVVAVTAAGVVTGFAHGPIRGEIRGEIASRLHLRHRPSAVILSLGALGYLVGLPATWRALHALEDLGHATGSPWRWAPLAAGSVVFALGYGLGTRFPRGPNG
jgi:hypothetical protein